MATTQNTFTGNGSTTTFAFTFPYIEESDVKVSLDAVDQTTGFSVDTTNIVFDTAPANNVAIRIYRDTGIEKAAATFFSGSAIRAQDLNDNVNQNLYVNQELRNRTALTTGSTITGDYVFVNADIQFEGSANDDYETTLSVVNPTADQTYRLPNLSAGTYDLITSGDTNTVTGTMIANDAINGDRIADDSINSEHYVDGSIDTAHIADGQITTAKITDANVTTAKLAADAVNGSKIADDSINSEHYVDGSIDTAHIADAQITTAKLADANVTTAKIADDAVTAAKIATGAVGPDALAATAVTAGSYTAADITVDADGRITAASTGAIATSEITDSAVTTAKIADANVTTAKIANDAINGTKIADDSINSEHYVDGSIDTAHIADQQVTAGKLATSAVTTGKIGADAITNAKIADDAVQAENINGLTASITELNQLDGNTLSNSSVDWTSGTTYPSASQISARLEAFGGFEAIADDESFPNTAPAEGVIISIANAGGLTVSSSGVSTNGDTLNDTTVTINNFPSGFNSTTLDDGIGLLVVATSTAHTYNFHRVVAKDEDVRQLSSDINDFKARYRTGSSNPTSDNDAGDLFFNTSTDKLLVRNGANNAWEEAQSIGEFFIIPSSDFPTWNGTLNDISITNNAPASAEQIILSINGVIQEPVAGSSRPSDGFSLNGSTIQLSAAPATGSEAWGVIVGSTVNIGTPSANTVSTAKIVDGAVTTAKIADDAVTAAKLADTAVTAGSYTLSSITVDAQGRITAASSGSAGDSDKIEEGNTAVEVVDTGSDGHITFDTEGSEKARFDTNGRLLIGHNANTTPAGFDHKVQITGTNGNTSSLSLTSNAGSSVHNEATITFGKTRGSTGGASNAISSGDTIGKIQFAAGDGTDVASIAADIKCSADGGVSGNDTPGRLIFETTADGAAAPTERMRITSSGRVGIGTTSPNQELHVNGDIQAGGDGNNGTAAGIVLNASGVMHLTHSTSGSAVLHIFNQGNTTSQTSLYANGSAIFNDEGHGVDFRVESANNANMLVVDGSADRVGIGTATPATTLEVEGAQAELQVQSTSGTNSAGFRMIPGGQTNAVYMYTDGNRNVNFDDHATAMISIRAGGGGITFHGDTAAANALDDYEEGTWTPSWINGASVTSYTTQSGRYTKIGRIVYFECVIHAAAGSVAAAHLRMGGLPFNAGSGPPYGGAYVVYTTIVDDVNNAHGHVPYVLSVNGTDDLYFYRRDGQFWNANDGIGTVIGKEVRLNGFYVAA